MREAVFTFASLKLYLIWVIENVSRVSLNVLGIHKKNRSDNNKLELFIETAVEFEKVSL